MRAHTHARTHDAILYSLQLIICSKVTTCVQGRKQKHDLANSNDGHLTMSPQR